MRYKYQDKLDGIDNCPAAHFRPRVIQASFRYVFADNTSGSFLPVLARSPERALKWDDTTRCGGWALSFFASADSARVHFESLRRNNPRIHKTLGDRIAVGSLARDDGVSSEAEQNGHFELHEYEGVKLYDRFSEVEVLI